jgi:uncharacterized protein (TIGR02271 family)
MSNFNEVHVGVCLHCAVRHQTSVDHPSTKDKIKEKIHKVREKLHGKDHNAHPEDRLPVFDSNRSRQGDAAPVDDTGLEYCNDLRCHALSPCARHPGEPQHHHHNGHAIPTSTGNQAQAHDDRSSRRFHGVAQCECPDTTGGCQGFADAAGATENHGLTLAEVPLHRPQLEAEEVVIERRPITNPDAYNPTFTDDHISIPLYKEEIVKRIVPAEEIIIRKRYVTDVQTVSAALRSEVADVTRFAEEDHAHEKVHGTMATGTGDDHAHMSLSEKLKEKLHLGYQAK